MAVAATPLRRLLPLSRPLDLAATLGLLRHGPQDPTIRLSAAEAARAARTPEGASAVRIVHRGDAVEAEAYGPGAAWALEQLPELLGEHDDPGPLPAAHPLVPDLQRRLPGLRIGRSRALVPALVAAIAEQKVVGLDAKRDHSRLVRALGEPAPGPLGLVLPPDPDRLAAQPYWAFHRFGFERRRAEIIRTVAGRARSVERLAERPPAEARAALQTLPGIGPWTAAEAAMAALGDTDAVQIGRAHV